MSGFLKERVIWLLDLTWPFPLGIVASALALLLAAGIWLGTRTPRPPSPGQPRVPASTTHVPAQVPSTPDLPAPSTATAGPGPTADQTPASGLTPAKEVSPAAAATEPPAAKPEAQGRPVAPQLSAKQKADFADRMTIGQFLVDRKEYPAAIKEFQAALAMDPSSREARTAIQKAREAGSQ